MLHASFPLYLSLISGAWLQEHMSLGTKPYVQGVPYPAHMGLSALDPKVPMHLYGLKTPRTISARVMYARMPAQHNIQESNTKFPGATWLISSEITLHSGKGFAQKKSAGTYLPPYNLIV